MVAVAAANVHGPEVRLYSAARSPECAHRPTYGDGGVRCAGVGVGVGAGVSYVGFVGPGGCLQCDCDVVRRCLPCKAKARAKVGAKAKTPGKEEEGGDEEEGDEEACGLCAAADAVMRVANGATWLALRLRMFGLSGGFRPSRTVADHACAAFGAALHYLFAQIRGARVELLYTHAVVTCPAGYFARDLAHPAVGVLPMCVALAVVGYRDGRRVAPGLQQPLRTLLRALPASAGPDMTRDARGWVRGHVYKPFAALLLMRHLDAAVREWVDDASKHIRADAAARARLTCSGSRAARDHVVRACLAVSVVPHVVTRWATRATGPGGELGDFVSNGCTAKDIARATAALVAVTAY